MERERGRLMELPVDTLVDILLRVPAKSVGCIKCVSKTLLKTVSDVSFSTLHTRLWAAAADQVPRLMFCSRNENLLSLQSVKYEENALTKGRYTINVSSSTPAYGRFVFHNIICLGFCWTGDCVLVNCLGERGVLRLPECIFARQERFSQVNPHCWFGMGFDDKTSTYKVLCVTCEKYDQIRHRAMRVHVLVLGTNSWRQISSLPPPEFSWIALEVKPTCANGAVHWLTGRERDRIVSFDFRREEFCWTPTPPALQQSSKEDCLESRMCLFTLKGCLAIVRTESLWSFSSGKIRNIEIWVLKDVEQEERLWEMYYNNKIPDCFPLEFEYPWVEEWEHGIYCTSNNFREISVDFIDVRSGSVNRVVYPLGGVTAGASTVIYDEYLCMYSYSETFISLKDYGDLEDAHQVITQS